MTEFVLNAADRGNALDMDMAIALREASRSLRSQVAGSALLRASGSNFCVGGDLRVFAEHEDDLRDYVHELASVVHEALDHFNHLDIPLVVAVQGAAAGGGLGLAISGDLILAAESARFRSAYTKVGLSPDCGATWRLPRLIGPQRALALFLTNRTLDALTALEWGMVTDVVPDDDLVERSRALAWQLTATSARALKAVKALVRTSQENDLTLQLQREAAFIAQLAESPESRSAVTRFVNH